MNIFYYKIYKIYKIDIEYYFIINFIKYEKIKQ